MYDLGARPRCFLRSSTRCVGTALHQNRGSRPHRCIGSWPCKTRSCGGSPRSRIPGRADCWHRHRSSTLSEMSSTSSSRACEDRRQNPRPARARRVTRTNSVVVHPPAWQFVLRSCSHVPHALRLVPERRQVSDEGHEVGQLTDGDAPQLSGNLEFSALGWNKVGKIGKGELSASAQQKSLAWLQLLNAAG